MNKPTMEELLFYVKTGKQLNFWRVLLCNDVTQDMAIKKVLRDAYTAIYKGKAHPFFPSCHSQSCTHFLSPNLFKINAEK